MYFEDKFDPNAENDIQKKELNNIKSYDKGYGYVYRKKQLANGKIARSRIDCYASGDSGTCIRNAETGEYYKELVGSVDEDLFFKLKMSDCEVKSKNGSNTLFYISPDHCMRHLNCDIPQNIINKWEV